MRDRVCACTGVSSSEYVCLCVRVCACVENIYCLKAMARLMAETHCDMDKDRVEILMKMLQVGQ
jgi:hypothetical protein